MRVGSRDLALWSFLMASAHGAGLMLLPFVLSHPQRRCRLARSSHDASECDAGPPSSMTLQWWFPVGLHTLGYLVATASLALVVYHKLGLPFCAVPGLTLTCCGSEHSWQWGF